jgi:hypothetical protein
MPATRGAQPRHIRAITCPPERHFNGIPDYSEPTRPNADTDSSHGPLGHAHHPHLPHGARWQCRVCRSSEGTVRSHQEDVQERAELGRFQLSLSGTWAAVLLGRAGRAGAGRFSRWRGPGRWPLVAAGGRLGPGRAGQVAAVASVTSAETSASWRPGHPSRSSACPARQVVSGAHGRDLLRRAGHLAGHPADGRHQLGDGVLGGHRIGQDRRVHCPAAPALLHSGLLDHRLDRVVDPVRPGRSRDPVPPVHQRRRIEPRVIQARRIIPAR